MRVLHGDFETGAVVDLSKTGLYRYAEDPETRILMLSYQFDGEDVRRWHPGDPEPRELLDHVASGGRFVAHNASFERVMWNVRLRALPRCAAWPRLEIGQMDCTMARALAMHLPGSLDELGVVLGLKAQKDTEGARLMRKMARPRKLFPPGPTPPEFTNGPEWTRRPGGGGYARWWTTPENLAREGLYCDQDVRTEAEADGILLPLSAEERALWELDQRINDRGVYLDVPTIRACVAVREVAKARADEQMAALTGGAVRKVSESGRIVEWLVGRGIPATSIAKGEHEELRAIAEALGDEKAVAVVDLRGEASKTSTAKFDKMLQTVCADGRVRGLFSYHRALTGRWGGASVQPQNLPRVDEDRDMPDVTATLRAMEMFA